MLVLYPHWVDEDDVNKAERARTWLRKRYASVVHPARRTDYHRGYQAAMEDVILTLTGKAHHQYFGGVTWEDTINEMLERKDDNGS